MWMNLAAFSEHCLTRHLQKKRHKKAKERITVLFTANAAGEKETPIVIGKATSPRCFKRLPNKRKPLGVPYFSNAKAWMNSKIFTTVLCRLNQRLVKNFIANGQCNMPS